MIDLALAVNDDNGEPSGRLHQAEFSDADGDLILALAYPVFEGIPFSFLSTDGQTDGLTITGKGVEKRSFACEGRRRRVGNLFWDSTWMRARIALDFAEALCRSGFVVDQGSLSDKRLREWRKSPKADRFAKARR